MPLDALNGRDSVSLADYLTTLGIVPVPIAELEDYKAEQVRNHPPNVLTTAKPYFVVGLVSWLILIGVGAAEPGVTNLITAITTGWMFGVIMGFLSAVLFAMVCHLFGISLRGNAHWVERYATKGRALDPSIPQPIREVAEYVRERLPRSYVVYGELIQHNQLIDPYLLIQMPATHWHSSNLPWAGQRVCLGIWEDDRVIRCAERLDD